MADIKPAYKRVLLKLSGEALAKDCGKGEILNYDFINEVCTSVKKCVEIGVQVAIVVGGGNIWRGGRQGANMNRSRADHMGMLATVINSLALQQGFEEVGAEAVVLTAIDMERIADPFTQRDAVKHLENGKIGVSLDLLFRISIYLGKSMDYFVMDNENANPQIKIENNIAPKLKQCDTQMLEMVGSFIDNLITYKETLSSSLKKDD